MLWPTHELRVIQEVRVVIGDWLQVSFHPKEYMFCCRLGVDVSQTSGGKITNLSHVFQVELSPRISSNLRQRAEFSISPFSRNTQVPFDYLPLRIVLSVCFTADKINDVKSKNVMPPSLFDRLPEELITKILDMIFEESDDYPEGAHRFLEYQIFKRDPESYHGSFGIEFLV